MISRVSSRIHLMFIPAILPIRPRLLLVLCSGVWVTACTSMRPVPQARAGAVLPWAATEPTRLVVSDSITLWLFAPREVRAGEAVPMRVELENTRPGWIEVSLGGRAPHADFVITDATGREVWSVYGGVVPLANEDPRRLDTDERLVFPLTWDQTSGSSVRSGARVAPGGYTIRARVRLGPGVAETPTRPLRIIGG